MFGEPGVKDGRLARSFAIAKSRAVERIAEHEPRIGRENKIGQTGLRRHDIDLNAEPAKYADERLPLGNSRRPITGARSAHPGIDFVFDAVIIRRAHEDTGLRHASHSTARRETVALS